MVAVLIAAIAGLIAADLISKYLGHPVHVIPAAVARDGRSYHWGDPRPLVASGVICALGLLLISIAALPGRFRVVPVASEDSLSVTGFTRAGLRRYLAAAATTVDGVASARVRVRRRHVRVLAVSPHARPSWRRRAFRAARPPSPSRLPSHGHGTAHDCARLVRDDPAAGVS